MKMLNNTFSYSRNREVLWNAKMKLCIMEVKCGINIAGWVSFYRIKNRKQSFQRQPAWFPEWMLVPQPTS